MCWSSGDRIQFGGEIFPALQTGTEARPAYCTLGTGSFPPVNGQERGDGHALPPSAKVGKGSVL